MNDVDEVTGAIIDEALRIHRALGPGLLESVYVTVLARALVRRGLRVERHKIIRFEYDGMVFEEGFRADLVVESRVIVEVKSVEQLARVHAKQLLTYLKLTGTSVGLLINFGAATLREGPRRIVNGYVPPSRRVNGESSRGAAETAEERLVALGRCVRANRRLKRSAVWNYE